jgi:hypothetical protein
MTPINSFNNRIRNVNSRHKVKRDRIEDNSREGETSGSVEQRGMPASEVFVTGGDEWEAIGNRDFVEGKGRPR